jgi:hypothetical protein
MRRVPACRGTIGVPVEDAAGVSDAMVERTHRGTEPTVWAGWVICAVAVLVISGLTHIVTGLVALLDEQDLAVRPDRLLVDVGYTTWGWVHIGIGVLLVLVGAGLLVGRTWARMLAVVVAFGSIVVSLGFLSAAPALAALVIAFDVLVIYAVTVHGQELRGTYARTDPRAGRYAR